MNADRVEEFWNIVAWLIIIYSLLIVFVNVIGLIWIFVTTESKNKKPIKKTIDWSRR